MPSTSVAQQKLMGMAYALKKGELDPKDASTEVQELADSMTLKQLKDFASTKHDGLPQYVEENIGIANVSGMGPIVLPGNGTIGSGDVPAGQGDAEEEYKKKKKKRKQMKHLTTFEAYSFDREGTEIKNPFTDETSVKEVDPNSWYGKDYAKSDIKKIVDASEGFIANYMMWKKMQPLDADEDQHADYGQYVKPHLDELVKIVKKHG